MEEKNQPFQFPSWRANLIKVLCEISPKRSKAGLTTNSPTKSRHWRVIGGHSATSTVLDGAARKLGGSRAIRRWCRRPRTARTSSPCAGRLARPRADSRPEQPGGRAAERARPFRPRGRSSRAISGQRDSVHDAAEAGIIVDRVVKRTAVVPKRGRAGLPAEATGELGSHPMREQILEQRRALRLGHADEAQRVAAVHVQGLAAGFGMRAHDWMLGLQHPGRLVGAAILARAGLLGLG